MLARLALACMAAVLGGFWLYRSIASPASATAESSRALDDTQAGSKSRAVRWLRILVLSWCALWAVIWLAIALLRLRYPVELEWCGGAMRDHCERILAGLPLYAAPGPDWIPYEYPPLYFWVSALLMRALHDGSFMSMRAVSTMSTIGCAAVLFLWVRHSTRSAAGRTWGAIAAGVFLATYRFTGAWYDVERLDMLFLLFALLGGYWLDLACGLSADRTNRTYRANTIDQPDERSGRSSGAAPEGRAIALVLLSAIAYWLAFLTKQQAVLFLFGSVAALAWSRQWRKLALFSAVSALLCLGSFALLNRVTDGWFGYYCFRVPLANGIRLNLAAQYFTTDLPLYAPLLALIAVRLILTRLPAGNPQHSTVSRPAATWCLMGLLGSLLSRAHWGGDQNVLMAGFIAITLAACMLAARLEATSQRRAAPLLALVFAQLIVLVYRPDAQVPSFANRDAGTRYAAAVSKLEQQGEVLCLDHGAVTSPRHFHLMALLDVVGTEKGLPPSLMQALKSRRFSAILTDAKPAPGGALDALTANYIPAECLKIDTPWVVTGFPTPDKGRPVWILRPK